MYINDRAKELMDQNKIILNSFEYVDSIPFFNAHLDDPWKALADRDIDLSVWKPYEAERVFGPLPGELGIWISYLNVFNYILESKTQKMLVIEDDAILKENSAKVIDNLVKSLPEGWDFLSLHHNDGQNELNSETYIGSDQIHKSINQFASTVAVVYSYSFAKKFLNIVKDKGIEYTVDCFLYNQSRLGLINGYSIIAGEDKVVNHVSKIYNSTIDPKNVRNPGMEL